MGQGIGQAFFLTGRGKLEHIDNFTRSLTDLGIPFPALNAAFVARVEYYLAEVLSHLEPREGHDEIHAKLLKEILPGPPNGPATPGAH